MPCQGETAIIVIHAESIGELSQGRVSEFFFCTYEYAANLLERVCFASSMMPVFLLNTTTYRIERAVDQLDDMEMISNQSCVG